MGYRSKQSRNNSTSEQGRKTKTQSKNDQRNGKSEGKENFNTKKLKNGGKPKGHGVNTTNHHAPGGHVTCGAATTHLIRSETPRVMDNSGKSFIFYGRHDMSQQPQKLGGN